MNNMDSNNLIGKKILIVTDSRVWSLGEGRNYRFKCLVSGFLKYGMSIDLVTSRKNMEPSEIESLRAAGIDAIITGEDHVTNKQEKYLPKKIRDFTPNSIIILFRFIRKVFYEIILFLSFSNKKTPKISDIRSPLLPILVEKYVKKNKPDFILVVYIMHSYALQFLKNIPVNLRPVTMIDTNDVAYKRCESLRENSVKLSCIINRDEEREILKKFDIVIAIQDEDRKIFADMLPGSNVVTCYPSCQTITLAPIETKCKKTLIYVGGDSDPNYYGLMDFLERVWPQVIKAHPDAELIVVGTICRKFEKKSYPCVSFRGYIENLSQVYKDSCLAIAPVMFGGGLKIKVLEALLFGRPVVATGHSAIGFSGAVGHGLFVAEDWGSFANVINELVNNPSRIREAGKSAVDYVSRHFGEACVMKSLIAAMKSKLEERNCISVSEEKMKWEVV